MSTTSHLDWRNHPESAREAFLADGYIVFRNFLSSEEVANVHNNLARFIAEVLPDLPREQVFYEDLDDPTSLKQIQQMYTHDHFFKSLFFQSKFEAVAEALLAGPVVGKNMQYFNKPPLIGKPTPPHQDGYYFMIKPVEATTMWLALDEVDEKNGCVRYVQGSNHLGMRPHGRTKTLGFSQGVTDYGTEADKANEVALLAQPGDLLAHHAMVIHRADGNQSSTRQRRALGFIYYSERAKIDEEAHAAYQKRLAAEMKQDGKI
ncbi:MAG: phytanoyl-CoA dioxygenase family protein [Chloroflexota bacterium]